MKYLIQVDNELIGYNRLDLLRIDIATNKPGDYKLFVRVNDGLVILKYVETTIEVENGKAN